jgi:hypothetical protein
MKHPIAAGLLLAGLLAGLQCGAQDPGAIPIRISGNGRYFEGRDGRPFYWQGDTEWELFHLFPVPDARALIQTRRAQGFNVMQVMVTGVYPEWGVMKGMKPWSAIRPWIDDNPLTPNEDYFRRVDAIVAVADKCGMTLVVGIYHALDQDHGRIGVQNVGPWARWLSHRYRGSKNIIWCMYPHAIAASEPVIRAAVQGLVAGDRGVHLITMHPDPSPNSSSFMHREPWLSFNTLQSWSTGFSNYNLVAADFAKVPAKPVVDGEARYEEEDGTTPLEVRRAGYWACLAGGFYSYGHRDNWMSPSSWRTYEGAPGALQMKVLGDLFRSIDWWKLLPDPSLVLNGAKGDVAARSASGDWILAYLTGPAPVTINLGGITAPGPVTGWWIDPLNGIRTRIGTFPSHGSRAFAPPGGWEDAILLLKN